MVISYALEGSEEVIKINKLKPTNGILGQTNIFLDIYTKEQLATHLYKIINELKNNNNTPHFITILFEANYHAVAVIYDPKNNCCKIVDSERFYLLNNDYPVYESLFNQSLSNELISSFGAEYRTAMMTRILANWEKTLSLGSRLDGLNVENHWHEIFNRNDADDLQNLQSFLLLATRVNNCSAIGKLLSNPSIKIDVSHDTYDHMTALLIACADGCYDAAKLFIEKKADIFKKNDSGQDALGIVTIRGNVEMVKLIIDNFDASQADSRIKKNSLEESLVITQKENCGESIINIINEKLRSLQSFRLKLN